MSKEVSEEAEQAPPKDYTDPPPAPLLDMGELRLWAFYRALIAEFVAPSSSSTFPSPPSSATRSSPRTIRAVGESHPPARIGRSPVRRAADPGAVPPPPRGLSVDSPRMNPAGKIVFPGKEFE